MSTLTQLRSNIRFLAKQSSTDISDANLNTIINRNYRKLVNLVMGFNESYYEVSTTSNVVADQQNYEFNTSGSDFNITDLMEIKRLEITYDGTNWYKAESMDKNERGLSLASNAISDFVKTKPFYYIEGDAFFMLPIPDENQTNGLKLWYIQEQTDLSADADVPNIPDNYHYLIEKLSLSDIGTRISDYNLKDRMEQDYQIGVQRMKNEISPRDLSGNTVLKSAFINYE